MNLSTYRNHLKSLSFYFGLYCLVFPFESKAQNELSSFQVYESKGDIPSILSTYSKGLYIQESIYPHSKKSALKKGDRTAILYEILNSGMVVYGDEISNYGDRVVQQMKNYDPSIPADLKILTLKSNVACTFSFGKEVVFVTTGLISQLTNEAQLVYFIARELEHVKKSDVSTYSKNLNLSSSFEDKIIGISKFDIAIEKKTDAEALQILSKMSYPLSVASVCLDILQYASLPFEDRYVPTNYFTSEQMYVPSSFFDVIDKKGIITPSNPFNVNQFEVEIKARKKDLEAKIAALNSTTNSPVFQLAQEDFFKMRDFARLETIHLQISECDFSKALYSIFVMEQKLPMLMYLKRMKAYAWLGLVEQSFGNVDKKTVKNIGTFQSEAQRFFRVLLRLNATGKAAFALRIATDFKNNFPEITDFSLIQERIILLIRDNPLFDVKKFSNQTFSAKSNEEIKTPTDTSNTKYDLIEKARNQSANLFIDSNQFYFYGLSDLINNHVFMDEFDSLKRTKPVSKIDQQIEFVNTPPIYFKHQKIVSKSTKRLKQMNDDLAHLSKITQLELSSKSNLLDAKLTTDQYNEMAIYASVYNQLYHSSKYSEVVLPIDGLQLKQLQSVYGIGTIAIPVIRSTYRPQLKGAQILGLMVAPLPLVVPPIWFSGFKSQFTIMYIHLKDGTLTSIDHQLFKDPMTRYLLKNRFYHSISKYHNSKTY